MVMAVAGRYLYGLHHNKVDMCKNNAEHIGLQSAHRVGSGK